MAVTKEATPAIGERGEIYRVAGPVITATDIRPKMYDVILVGEEQLMGEVIGLVGDRTIIQVYEDTSGVRPGEQVIDTGQPLLVELGPGLLGSIFDGVQRPLPTLKDRMGDYILRGVRANALDRGTTWEFQPQVKQGDELNGGDIIGLVQEAKYVEHRVLAPPGLRGTVKEVHEGKVNVEDTVLTLEDGKTAPMMQNWPVRVPRPVKERLMPTIPLITGQRVFDFFFPLAKGGTAAIPGGFGTGKCVVGSTPVLLADGRVVPIQELYEAAVGEASKDSPEHFHELDEPLDVLTFDGERIREGRATTVYRGRTNRLMEVRLRSGRRVRLTPVHRLFRFDGTSVVETPAEELKEGDAVLVPRQLPLAERAGPLKLPPEARVWNRQAQERIAARLKALGRGRPIAEIAQSLNLTEDTYWSYRLLRAPPPVALAERLGVEVSSIRPAGGRKVVTVPGSMTEELAEFLGLQLSDGTIKAGQVVEFYNNDDDLRRRYRYLLKTLFGLDGKERRDRTVSAVSVSSRALVQLLEVWGVPTHRKSRSLRPPDGLYTASREAVSAFLRAYVAGDGHFAEEVLEIATASRWMATGLAYLFGRLGIFTRMTEKMIRGKPYYRVWVSPKEGAKLFSRYKRERHYDSYDVVPLEGGKVGAIRRALSTPLGEWAQPLKNAAAGERTSRAIVHGLSGGVEPASPAGMWLREIDTMLDHVLLDRVIEVRSWSEETDVYDLTVEDTHNFVGGEMPMILHNTVSGHQLTKWCDAQIVVYIGCGERGNEMTEMLAMLPETVDPKTEEPLMDRTIMVANTSNMPVAAREASVYTGMTLAEYYRDMGYHVYLTADSTSRWAEAMREISSRLEEMPGEEGFPAYLSARLSEFYERAGRATTLNGQEGSVSVVGAVSPSGGDFSEPVTQGTLRITKVFWALDTKLRERRHFPAINWLTSYSLYSPTLEAWFREQVHEDWPSLRAWAQRVLQEESELEEIVRLVGADALPEDQQLTLEVARMIREYFLQQNAFHPVDTYCTLENQLRIIEAVKRYDDLGRRALALEAPLGEITTLPSRTRLSRAKYEENLEEELEATLAQMEEEFRKLEAS